MLGQVIKRPFGKSFDLPPRMFTQLVDPRKRCAHSGDVLDRAHRDRSDYLDSIDTGRSLSAVCVGFFWGSVNKRQVVIQFGMVFCRPVDAYRPASFLVIASLGVATEFLSREEGAGSYAFDLPGEERPQRGTSEDVPQPGKNGPGPYVIPGQVLTGWQNTLKTGGQNPIGQSIEITFDRGNRLVYAGVNTLANSNVKQVNGRSVRESSCFRHPVAPFDSDFEWSVEKCRAETC